MIRLKEILLELESGARPKGGVSENIQGIPSLGAEHLDERGGFDFSKIKYVPEDFYNKLNSGKIERGDTLVVKDGATTGKVSFVPRDFPFSASALNEHVFRLKPDPKKALPKYIFYFLFSPYGKQLILKDFRGATVGGISRDFVEKVKIELHSIDKQQKIISILDAAKSALEKRRQTLRLADKFLKSAFLEMFGDPVRNPKKLNSVSCGAIASHVSSGSTPLGGDKTYLKEGVLFIRSQNVLMNRLDLSDVAYISNEVHNKMKRTLVKKNDVLLNITGASIGRVSFFEGEDDTANVNQHVCIIRPDKSKILPQYLSFLISMPNYQKTILGKNAGATRQAFNFDQIKRFQIPLASLPEQQKFANLVQKVERLKEKQKQSETQLQNLFNSVLQRAFRGEL